MSTDHNEGIRQNGNKRKLRLSSPLSSAESNIPEHGSCHSCVSRPRQTPLTDHGGFSTNCLRSSQSIQDCYDKLGWHMNIKNDIFYHSRLTAKIKIIYPVLKGFPQSGHKLPWLPWLHLEWSHCPLNCSVQLPHAHLCSLRCPLHPCTFPHTNLECPFFSVLLQFSLLHRASRSKPLFLPVWNLHVICINDLAWLVVFSSISVLSSMWFLSFLRAGLYFFGFPAKLGWRPIL